MALHIPPSLRHRGFFLLWLGLMISITGSQMQVWALLWHINELTNAPIALGGIGAARIVPIIIFSLIGGAVADVANRRVVLYFTQTTMALAAAALAFFTLNGTITIWHIYILTAVQAMAQAFDGPARQALVPNLVPTEDLPNAFSLTSIAFQTGSILGPALNGLVIAYGSIAYTYLINAVSFLAVIIALLMIGPIRQERNLRVGTGISWPAIREGIEFIAHHPIILSTMITDFFATFFASANTLMPIYAKEILNVGAVAYGWLSAAQSVGAMAAALVISQMHEIRRQGLVFILAVVVFGGSTIVFGVSRLLILSFFALALMGAADSVSTIIRNTIRQIQTPDYIRGRMTSVNQIFFMGGPQLGEIEAGGVAQVFSTPFAIISGGIGTVIAIWLIVVRWPQIRRYNGDEPVEAGSTVG